MLADNRFTCHWDESGTDPGTGTKSKSDKPLLVVGGYFAHVDEWRSFERKWQGILEPTGLPFFHMVDFANLNWPYSTWDVEQREKFIEALLGVISETVRAWVAWAIEIDAYLEVIKAKNLLDTDIVRAYHICGKKCIESVALWRLVSGHPHKVLHIFDRGNAAWSTFASSFTQEMLDAYGILAPVAQSKTDVTPLQAADALAHQTARHLELSMGLKTEGPRCLYTTRLWTPPRLYVLRVIDTPTLSKMYREEMAAEELNWHGVPVYRTVNLNAVTRDQKLIAESLFKEAPRS